MYATFRQKLTTSTLSKEAQAYASQVADKARGHLVASARAEPVVHSSPSAQSSVTEAVMETDAGQPSTAKPAGVAASAELTKAEVKESTIDPNTQSSSSAASAEGVKVEETRVIAGGDEAVPMGGTLTSMTISDGSSTARASSDIRLTGTAETMVSTDRSAGAKGLSKGQQKSADNLDKYYQDLVKADPTAWHMNFKPGQYGTFLDYEGIPRCINCQKKGHSRDQCTAAGTSRDFDRNQKRGWRVPRHHDGTPPAKMARVANVEMTKPSVDIWVRHFQTGVPSLKTGHQCRTLSIQRDRKMIREHLTTQVDYGLQMLRNRSNSDWSRYNITFPFEDSNVHLVGFD